MPASSKAQQKFMGIVHSLQKGDIKPSDVSKSVKDAAKSMSKKDAKDFASTPHKGLPKKVKLEIVKRLKEYANKMGLDHLGGDSIPSNKKRGGLRDDDGYDNVDYNRDMPMDEAYIVLHSPKKGQKPVATAAYRDKKDAQKWEKDLKKKKGGITMIVQKKVKGVDESVNEAGMIPKLYSAFVGLKFKVKGLEEDQLKMLKQFKSEKDTNKKKALLDKMKKATVVLKKQRGYLSNLEADWLNKLDTVIKELAVTEGGLPQNWMAGRVSDYHTKLRGKKRKYDDTNFAKMNTGQPDIEDEELDPDNEVVNEKFNKVEHLSLLNKALKAMPGSQNQKEIIRQLNVVRKAGGMRPLKETAIEEYGQRLDLSYILDDESVLDGTPEEKDTINRESAQNKTKKNYKDWKNTNESVSTDAYTISRIMGTAQQSTQNFIDDNKIDVKKLKSYIKKLSPVKMIIFKDIVHGSTDKRLRNIKKGFIKQVKESVIDETAKRDYKDEYKKFQSSTKSKKYRAELNKYNRDKGTYGNGDNKDASHKGGKIVGFEKESVNRSRKEKSRLKK